MSDSWLSDALAGRRSARRELELALLPEAEEPEDRGWGDIGAGRGDPFEETYDYAETDAGIERMRVFDLDELANQTKEKNR